MLKFVGIFVSTLISCLIVNYIFDVSLSKSFLNIVIYISCFYTIISYLSEIKELSSAKTKKSEAGRGDEYNLVPFNDAIANELMRIRTDLITIKIKQDNLGWNKISNEFLRMFWTYKDYPSSFLCTYLETPDDCEDPDGYQGQIIVTLDDDINIDDFWDVNFDAAALRKINTLKRHKITNKLKSGMNLTVFIGEDKDKDKCSTYSRYAKIMSIKEKSYGENYLITLEINLKTELDDLYHSSTKKEDKSIIRQFIVSGKERHNFLSDKKEDLATA